MSLNAQKICDALLIIAFIVLITLPDVVTHLFVGLLHFLLEFTHISFEALEATLDFIIETLFHTGPHNTQVIVFYLMFAGLGYGLYQLWLRLPSLYRAFKDTIISIWILYKTRFTIYWHTASWLSKTRFIAITISMGYLFFLLSF